MCPYCSDTCFFWPLNLQINLSPYGTSGSRSLRRTFSSPTTLEGLRIIKTDSLWTMKLFRLCSFFYNFCSVFRGVLSSMISELTRTAEGGIFSLMNDIDQIIIFYPILSPLALWGEDHIQGFRIRQWNNSSAMKYFQTSIF